MPEATKFNKIAYNNEFNSKAYDRFTLSMPKGDKEKIKAYAESKGEKMNTYINRLIKEDMQKSL